MITLGAKKLDRYVLPALEALTIVSACGLAFAIDRTTGKFIAANTLMLDEYCLKCHQDAYNSHQHSMHRLSSFNNPAYLFSVKETRRVAGIRASRWCAGSVRARLVA